MDAARWIGRDEHEGPRAEPLPGAGPAPRWSVESVAHCGRPRSLAVGADGRTLVFIIDQADASDVWTMAIDESTPRRLTTGRAPAPYWEDVEPRLSPDCSTVAYCDDGWVCLVPVAGGQPRRLVEGGSSPVWIDDQRLIASFDRPERMTRFGIVDLTHPWPRRLTLDCFDTGDESDIEISADGTMGTYTFTVRANLRESQVCDVHIESGVSRPLTSPPDTADRHSTWSPDRSHIAFASEESGWYELHVIDRDGGDRRRLTHDEADFLHPSWSADGSRILATRLRRGRTDLVTVDAATGDVDVLATGGTWSGASWAADGAVVAEYSDHATPPELRLVTADGQVRTLLAPAPAAVRSAPHVVPEDVEYASLDGTAIHAFLFRPRDASAQSPAPAIVLPHGGPTSLYADEWDGHVQCLVDRGFAVIAPNFRGSISYGRAFERLNHGDWGVGDTRDCLAAADFLRTLDWVDGDRLGVAGASYGSYLALLCATDDDAGRFRAAVCVYGDCDIRTSWAQGDRGGAQDLERMMGTPHSNPAGYDAGSPVDRVDRVRIPLLIAHGERDERVHPRQSEQLVAALRSVGGRTFEYVTYPTEAHGFLRFEPQVDFHRRLERFLAWHLRG